MAFTRHGHLIEGSSAEWAEYYAVARCGGPGLCGECSNEQALWQAKHLDVPLIDEKAPSQILRYFEYGHLPSNLAAVSIHFFVVASKIDKFLPEGPEKDVALRKLLEAKDAAVRSALDL